LRLDADALRERTLETTVLLMVLFALLFPMVWTLDITLKIATVPVLTGVRVLSLLSCLACLAAFAHRIPGGLRDPVLVVFGLLFVSAAFVGLLNRNNVDAFLRQAFGHVFMAAFYCFGKLVYLQAPREKVLRLLSTVVLAGYSVALLLYLRTPGLHSGAYSYAPGLALLSLAYCMVTDSFVGTILAALLIVFGNKRADLLGASLIIAFYVVDMFVRRQGPEERGAFAVKKLAALAVVFVAVSVLVIQGLSELSTLGVPHLAVADRFALKPALRGRGGYLLVRPAPQVRGKTNWVSRFTSGRDAEFRAVSESLLEAPLGHVIGKGFGGTFEMNYLSPYTGDVVLFERTSADVLLAHLGLVNGYPAGLVFLTVLLYVHLRIAVRSHRYGRYPYVFALFFSGFLLDVSLGFVQTNPFYWTALGFLRTDLVASGDQSLAGGRVGAGHQVAAATTGVA
jgi:hypothetical protein